MERGRSPSLQQKFHTAIRSNLGTGTNHNSTDQTAFPPFDLLQQQSYTENVSISQGNSNAYDTVLTAVLK